jgi:hypothetical protein
MCHSPENIFIKYIHRRGYTGTNGRHSNRDGISERIRLLKLCFVQLVFRFDVDFQNADSQNGNKITRNFASFDDS